MLRFPEALLQQFYHVQCNRILDDIEVQGGIDITQFELRNTLYALLLMMIYHQLQDVTWLKEIPLCLWFGRAYAVDHIGLHAEEFSEYIDDGAGIAIFDRS